MFWKFYLQEFLITAVHKRGLISGVRLQDSFLDQAFHLSKDLIFLYHKTLVHVELLISLKKFATG